MSIPQSEPLDASQVKNNAGGYGWALDDRKRVHRFLCFGIEGGTYYVGEKELGLENALCIDRMIKGGRGSELLEDIVSFSVEGRAAKQNPIIFALAMCCRNDGNEDLKKQAYKSVAEVCRIPTHLFSFIEYCEKLSRGTGWGRAHRRAIADWYTRFKEDPAKLAMHVTKYKNRNGWTHTDVLRLAHPKASTTSDAVAAILKYIIKGLEKVKEDFTSDSMVDDVKKTIEFLEAVEDAKSADEIKIVQLIQEFGLVREHIPTKLLNNLEVWRALLQKMPMTAMMRNLSKMSAIGLLSKDSIEEQMVVKRFMNEDALKKAKIHPFNVLVALCTYKSGRGVKGKLTWDPNDAIVSALDAAFYKSFKHVEATNQRYLLALDVSGSMTCGNVNGSTGINPREASAALSMVTARTESNYTMVGFSDRLVPINIKPTMDLPSVISVIERVPMGGTDCALPMVYAKERNLKVDVFVVYTDCETWAGNIHPAQALKEYRFKSGVWNAKLIVCGMTSNGFTIADPQDPGMLDMAGFDSSGPQVMRDFVLGF